MTTYYLDFEGGNDANDGTSFANRRKTLTDFSAADLAPGDTVRIMASLDATSLGMTAAWTNLSPTVTLNSALTANVSLCQAGWTASANVTSTTSVARKEGTVSTSIAVAAGFTTGLAAYEATGTLDLSGYQQISFWIQQTAGTNIIAGDVTLELCSDTVGAVSVQSIAIPAIVGGAGQWHCVTVDIGGALPAAVESIAFYVGVDRGAQTFQIDNIIACKASSAADSLTLNSLIGKNADDGLWWPIRSINGTTVTLDMEIQSSNGTASRGYVGTTETVTTYKREPIRPTPAAANFADVNDSGTSGSPITLSGGWNRTDMSTQTGETWVSNSTSGSVAVFLAINSQSYITCEKLSAVRYTTGFQMTTGTNNTFGSTCNAVGCTSGVACTGDASAAQTDSFDFGYAYCCGNGFRDTTTDAAGRILGTWQGIYSCSTNGILVGGGNNVIFQGGVTNLTAINNCVTGILLDETNIGWRGKVGTIANCTTGMNFLTRGASAAPSDRCTLIDTVFTGNTTDVTGGNGARNHLINCALGSSTEFAALTAMQGGRITSQKHDQTANNHYIWDHLGVISTTAGTVHGSSTFSWRMAPTKAAAVANAPLTLDLDGVAVNASAQVTITAWVQRSNTGLTLKLVIPGGQIGGVASDVSATASAAINTWEQLSVVCTPNEAGVITPQLQAYGGTTYTALACDFGMSQA